MQATHPFFPAVAADTPADNQITRLKQQMASAAAATNRLGQTGTREQYMRSFFLEDALELQLARLLGAPR